MERWKKWEWEVQVIHEDGSKGRLSPYKITNLGLVNVRKEISECLQNLILRGECKIQKIPKKVNGLEAWKAYTEGEIIKSLVSGQKYGGRRNEEMWNASHKEIDGDWVICE